MTTSREEDDEVQLLQLDRSLSLQKSEIQEAEERIQKMMIDKQSLSTVLTTLDDVFKANAKLELCIQLFFESSGTDNEIKEYIFNGKLLDAYENFVKLEKYRNELIAITKANDADNNLVARRFTNVEVMATQIRDVIRLTLASRRSIEQNLIDQILKIIENERLLDELSEKQRNEGKRVVLERPRHWAAVFRQILTEQAKHGKCGDYDAVAAVIRRQLDGPLDCDASISKMTNEEDDHHEELLALSKHFTSLRNKEARFQREVTDLFNSDDLLKKAHDCIVEGNILDAYEKLIQAESARFHLLSEVSKHNETHVVQKMINQNAALLEEGFNGFVKSAMYICARCVDVMRNKDSEPRRQLENLLKIIEIDHRIDEQYESLKVSCKQRPRCWRKKFFAVIEQRVQERIEVFHVEKKSSNENWIARYLEICRMFIVEDLFAAKHFLRIFPRKHQLYDRFVFFYHKGISNKLCEMVTNELDRREIVQLLNWIRIYPSEELLGMPFLQINVSALLDDYPLLPYIEIERLHSQFVIATKDEVSSWTVKAIRQEFAIKEKNCKENVEEDELGCYYTQLPYILFSIIHDQMSLAREISDEIVPRVLDVCLTEFIKATIFFQKEVIELKNRSYEDKEHVTEFTLTMVTIANDLNMCVESCERLRKYIPSLNESTVRRGSATSTIVPVKPIIVHAEMPRKQSTALRLSVEECNLKTKQHFGMRSAIRDAVSAIKDVTLAKISSSSSSNSLAELGTQVTGGRNITDSVPSSAKSKPSGSTSSQSSKGVPINVQVSDSISLGDEISLASEAEAAQISAVEKFYELKERFLGILQTTLSSLSGEVFDDLADFFEQLLGKKWIKSSHAIDTICMTILDYYSDHKHLRPCLRIELMMCIEFKLIAEYLISIASRVITCSNYEKRCAIAKALKRDVLCINRTFQPIFQQHKCDENIADLANILLRVADFIGLRDKSMISLEATSFVRTYPDIHSEMLFALLDVRDDLSSSESRAMADECIRVAGGRNGEPLFARLFQMCKGERKTSQIIKDVVPRLRRRVRLSIV